MTLAWLMAIGACATRASLYLRAGICHSWAAVGRRLRGPLRSGIRWLAILLTGLGMGAWGASQPIVRSDPNYLVDNWTTQDGLPENSATAIVQTPDGYLWFGTFEGLVRFNGTEFTVYNPANTPELPSAGIVNLHLDRRGRLWVSTYSGLVLRDGDHWRLVHAEEVRPVSYTHLTLPTIYSV